MLTRFLDWLFGRKPPAVPAPLGDPAAVLVIVNQYRATFRLPPVAADPRVAAVAVRYAAVMASRGSQGHDLDGNPGQRLTAGGVPWRQYAENVAPPGYADARAVVAAWMGEPAHRANVLGPYTRAGAGWSGGYWCLDLVA